MKKLPRRLAAFGLSAMMLCTAAFALTPQELGDILKNEYAGEVPARVWEQTTVDGMLSALGEPFSRYYTAEEYAKFNATLSGAGEDGPTAEVTTQDGVGRVRIRAFGSDTYEQIKSGMERAGDLDHWIVDVRGNHGGALLATADALSAFAGGGELIYLRDKDGKLYSAKSIHNKLTIRPAIVLVDGQTASAGELYAAGIRDRQRGLVIGERTYGKGVAQSAFDKTHAQYGAAFADGSALLLTTERAFSDNFASNNIMGVLPHLVGDADQAEAVAKLLCADAPMGNTSGYLRLHLARWRWYVKTDEAKADPSALKALLEALPPQALLYAGTGGADGWKAVTPAEAAASLGVSGFTSRAFPDVAGSQYADAINALKTYGIVKGDENGSFNPTAGLDRASLCALLAQAMNFPKSTAAPAFADTPADAWYTPYVTTLSAMGIVNGYDDGLFHPNDPIPHQQFMTILARVMANTDYASANALQTGPSQAALDSGDYAAYDPWAVPGAWLLDGSWHEDAKDIDPHAVTTRAEAAYDLWSALSTLGLLPG